MVKADKVTEFVHHRGPSLGIAATLSEQLGKVRPIEGDSTAHEYLLARTFRCCRV